MNIIYTKYVDYLLPNLTLPEKENKKLNKYGLLRLEYLKINIIYYKFNILEYLNNNKKALYQELLMKDKLNEHLFSVSINAENKINHIINELIKSDTSITEKLKLENQLLWVQKMNNYKNIAEEMILKEIIYGDTI